MRLDKYLKVSRIIKRRTLAKEVSDAGRVLINNKVAKSSTTVNVGDIVEIKYGNKLFIIKVKELLESTKKDDAKTMYEIIEDKRLNESN